MRLAATQLELGGVGMHLAQVGLGERDCQTRLPAPRASASGMRASSGDMPSKPGDQGEVGAVAAAGRSERAVQKDLARGGLTAEDGSRERAEAHRTGGVAGARADHDGPDDVEDASLSCHAPDSSRRDGRIVAQLPAVHPWRAIRSCARCESVRRHFTRAV